MFNYVIRRLLLMIPTFLGATLLVFIILQMAPGGPLEKTIMQIQMGGTQGGGEGGASSNAASSETGTLLPKRALKELERFYEFKKAGMTDLSIRLFDNPMAGLKMIGEKVLPALKH